MNGNFFFAVLLLVGAVLYAVWVGRRRARAARPETPRGADEAQSAERLLDELERRIDGALAAFEETRKELLEIVERAERVATRMEGNAPRRRGAARGEEIVREVAPRAVATPSERSARERTVPPAASAEASAAVPEGPAAVPSAGSVGELRLGIRDLE